MLCVSLCKCQLTERWTLESIFHLEFYSDSFLCCVLLYYCARKITTEKKQWQLNMIRLIYLTLTITSPVGILNLLCSLTRSVRFVHSESVTILTQVWMKMDKTAVVDVLMMRFVSLCYIVGSHADRETGWCACLYYLNTVEYLSFLICF